MMTEQEREAIEQAAKPQRWGSRERVTLVAEVLRHKRMIEWLCEHLEYRSQETAKAWKHLAEMAAAEDLSPKG